MDFFLSFFFFFPYLSFLFVCVWAFIWAGVANCIFTQAPFFEFAVCLWFNVKVVAKSLKWFRLSNTLSLPLKLRQTATKKWSIAFTGYQNNRLCERFYTSGTEGIHRAFKLCIEESNSLAKEYQKIIVIQEDAMQCYSSREMQCGSPLPPIIKTTIFLFRRSS